MTPNTEQPSGTLQLPAGRFRFDPIHTFASFSVKHQLIGRVAGRFDKLAGSRLVTDGADPHVDQIEASIDAASVDTNVEARDEDLRSPRFFDAATLETLTFRGASSAIGPDGGSVVTGDLTIRAITLPVSFDVTVRGSILDPHGHTRLGAMATTMLTRRGFGLIPELEQESGDSTDPDIEVRLDIETVLDA